MSESAPSKWRWFYYAAGAVVFLGAAILLFARTVDRDLNHDEHQFLAPAALFNREGLQPWRDYPLFHLPNLVFAYAAADGLTGDIIFGAKMVCFTASAAVLLGLVVASFRGPGNRPLIGLVLASSALLLLLGDPLFRYTAGKTWNHEVPTALLLAAIGFIAAAGKRDRLWLTALAGVCGGLATGCRLTFAPTLVGLFAFVWFLRASLQRRAVHAAVLTISATLSLSPSLYYLATQREAFVFGNFEFPRLRLLDPTDTRAHETVAWWRKARFFYKEIVRGSWAVFLSYAAFGVPVAWRWFRQRENSDITSAAILILIPFLLLGCFAPSRYQYQHYYVFVPILVYGLIVGVRSQVLRVQIVALLICPGLGILVALQAAEDYRIQILANRDEWFSNKAASVGARIRERDIPSGRVLTLAPTLVLAGGLQIYPELATGAFGWRVAHHMPADRRSTLHLIAPEDLATRLKSDPPAAILTGVEETDEEAPLIAWAEQNGYERFDLRKQRFLWLPRR